MSLNNLEVFNFVVIKKRVYFRILFSNLYVLPMKIILCNLFYHIYIRMDFSRQQINYILVIQCYILYNLICHQAVEYVLSLSQTSGQRLLKGVWRRMSEYEHLMEVRTLCCWFAGKVFVCDRLEFHAAGYNESRKWNEGEPEDYEALSWRGIIWK